MYISDKEAKELICTIGQKMYQRQFVSANDGNLTIRVGENAIIATPTGISKGDLTLDKLLKVDFAGNILEGTYKPTSELPMHLRIYKENNEIQSTAHAHPTFLNCIANLGAEMDLPLTPATAAISGRIPVAPYCNPGSEDLADSVAPYVHDFCVVLLANHGPIAWGHTPVEAFYILEDAEAYAKMAIIQKYILKDYRPVSRSQIQELAETHGITINPKRFVNAPETTNNTEPSISLDALETDTVKIDDSTIEKIAELVAKKLKG
ncbi:MAG: class II aldolase/adducin family protein [Anaerolineaceae bacterium]